MLKFLSFLVSLMIVSACASNDSKDDRPSETGLRTGLGQIVSVSGTLSADRTGLVSGNANHRFEMNVVVELDGGLNAARLNIKDVETNCASSDLAFAIIEIVPETSTIALPTLSNFLEVESFDLGTLPRGRNTFHFAVSGSKPCSFSLSMSVN